jgi:hypothetical protein
MIIYFVNSGTPTGRKLLNNDANRIKKNNKTILKASEKVITLYHEICYFQITILEFKIEIGN